MDAADGRVVTPDGRTLTYLEVGSPTGPLVLHNHGGPGSRHEARLFADAAAGLGLRLVCVDRPGFGGSSPQHPRSFSGWAADLVSVAEALGHTTFGVSGWSEGGPWALAAAAYLDADRVRHVTSIAPACYGAFGANSAAEHLSKTDAFGAALALRFPAGLRLMYAGLGLSARRFPDSYAKQVGKLANDDDRRILARPDVREVFLAESAECFAQGSAGLVRDAEQLYRRWPFDVRSIERPVHLWQGLDDRLVPDVINREVAEAMPGAVWHQVPAAGHFVAVGAAHDIFAVAAAELDA